MLGGLSLSWTPAWVEARRTDGQRSTFGAPLARGATYCHRYELEVWSWFIHFFEIGFLVVGTFMPDVAPEGRALGRGTGITPFCLVNSFVSSWLFISCTL